MPKRKKGIEGGGAEFDDADYEHQPSPEETINSLKNKIGNEIARGYDLLKILEDELGRKDDEIKNLLDEAGQLKANLGNTDSSNLSSLISDAEAKFKKIRNEMDDFGFKIDNYRREDADSKKSESKGADSFAAQEDDEMAEKNLNNDSTNNTENNKEAPTQSQITRKKIIEHSPVAENQYNKFVKNFEDKLEKAGAIKESLDSDGLEQLNTLEKSFEDEKLKYREYVDDITNNPETVNIGILMSIAHAQEKIDNLINQYNDLLNRFEQRKSQPEEEVNDPEKGEVQNEHSQEELEDVAAQGYGASQKLEFDDPTSESLPDMDHAAGLEDEKKEKFKEERDALLQPLKASLGQTQDRFNALSGDRLNDDQKKESSEIKRSLVETGLKLDSLFSNDSVELTEVNAFVGQVNELILRANNLAQEIENEPTADEKKWNEIATEANKVYGWEEKFGAEVVWDVLPNTERDNYNQLINAHKEHVRVLNDEIEKYQADNTYSLLNETVDAELAELNKFNHSYKELVEKLIKENSQREKLAQWITKGVEIYGVFEELYYNRDSSYLSLENEEKFNNLRFDIHNIEFEIQGAIEKAEENISEFSDENKIENLLNDLEKAINKYRELIKEAKAESENPENIINAANEKKEDALRRSKSVYDKYKDRADTETQKSVLDLLEYRIQNLSEYGDDTVEGLDAAKEYYDFVGGSVICINDIINALEASFNAEIQDLVEPIYKEVADLRNSLNKSIQEQETEEKRDKLESLLIGALGTLYYIDGQNYLGKQIYQYKQEGVSDELIKEDLDEKRSIIASCKKDSEKIIAKFEKSEISPEEKVGTELLILNNNYQKGINLLHSLAVNEADDGKRGQINNLADELANIQESFYNSTKENLLKAANSGDESLEEEVNNLGEILNKKINSARDILGQDNIENIYDIAKEQNQEFDKLKSNLEEARENLLKADEDNREELLKEYEKARLEFAQENINRVLNEQIALTESRGRVKQEESSGKLQNALLKIDSWNKKIGSWNLGRVVDFKGLNFEFLKVNRDDSRFKRFLKKTPDFLIKTSLNAASVRTALIGAGLGVGAATGSLALMAGAYALRGTGGISAGLASHDLMKSYREGKITKDIEPEKIKKLNDEDLKNRISWFSTSLQMGNLEVKDNKTYKALREEFELRFNTETAKKTHDTVSKELESQSKYADEEITKTASKYKKKSRRRKVWSTAIAGAIAAGLPGKALAAYFTGEVAANPNNIIGNQEMFESLVDDLDDIKELIVTEEMQQALNDNNVRDITLSRILDRVENGNNPDLANQVKEFFKTNYNFPNSHQQPDNPPGEPVNLNNNALNPLAVNPTGSANQSQVQVPGAESVPDSLTNKPTSASAPQTPNKSLSAPAPESASATPDTNNSAPAPAETKSKHFEDIIDTQKVDKGNDSIWRSTRQIFKDNASELGYGGDLNNEDELYEWSENQTRQVVSEYSETQADGKIKDLVHNADKVSIDIENGKPVLSVSYDSGEEADYLPKETKTLHRAVEENNNVQQAGDSAEAEPSKDVNNIQANELSGQEQAGAKQGTKLGVKEGESLLTTAGQPNITNVEQGSSVNSTEGVSLPASGAEAVDLMRKEGVLPQDMATKYIKEVLPQSANKDIADFLKTYPEDRLSSFVIKGGAGSDIESFITNKSAPEIKSMLEDYNQELIESTKNLKQYLEENPSSRNQTIEVNDNNKYQSILDRNGNVIIAERLADTRWKLHSFDEDNDEWVDYNKPRRLWFDKSKLQSDEVLDLVYGNTDEPVLPAELSEKIDVSKMGYEPDIEYFKIGSREFRLIDKENGVYEFNATSSDALPGKPGSAFSKGGLADGYIKLNKDGTVAEASVDYSRIDNSIAEKKEFLSDEIVNTTPEERDYQFYQKAIKLLDNLQNTNAKPVINTPPELSDKPNLAPEMEIAPTPKPKINVPNFADDSEVASEMDVSNNDDKNINQQNRNRDIKSLDDDSKNSAKNQVAQALEKEGTLEAIKNNSSSGADVAKGLNSADLFENQPDKILRKGITENDVPGNKESESPLDTKEDTLGLEKKLDNFDINENDKNNIKEFLTDEKNIRGVKEWWPIKKAALDSGGQLSPAEQDKVALVFVHQALNNIIEDSNQENINTLAQLVDKNKVGDNWEPLQKIFGKDLMDSFQNFIKSNK